MGLNIENGIVNLAVENLDRSLSFYVDKLGFQVLDRAADNWTLLQAGSFQLALVPAGQPVKPRASSILFVVANINRALREITRAGIEVAEFFPESSLAQFKDPDGHLLGIIEERETQSGEQGQTSGGR